MKNTNIDINRRIWEAIKYYGVSGILRSKFVKNYAPVFNVSERTLYHHIRQLKAMNAVKVEYDLVIIANPDFCW